VLPCHNEEANIEAVIKEALETLAEVADDFEVIVVDDGSTDRTREIVEEFKKSDPRIKLIKHNQNLGYGSALRSGFQVAQKDWIFLTDADRQFQLREIHRLVQELGRSRMVIGYRNPRKDPIHRRLYGEVYSFIIRILFGLNARDVNCAFKLFDRKILDAETMVSTGALISAELLIIARRKGITPVQVPVSHFPRKAGAQSGGSVRVILRAGKELLKLLFKKR